MGSKNVIGELLGGSVGNQAELARRADLAKSTVSKAVNGGGMGIKSAHKSGPPLGVDGDVLYGAVNLAAALKALEEGEADEADTLERIGRIVRTLGKTDVDEDTPGMAEVLDAIEEAIEELDAVGSVRGSTKKPASTATKSRSDLPVHSAFDVALKHATGGSSSVDNDEGDEDRDFWGRRIKPLPEDLRVDAEHDDDDDDDDGDGRDAFGQRVR